MKLGAAYPQVELQGDPASLRRFALAIEALGYDHLLMYDHVVGAQPADRDPPLSGGYTDKDPFHDPFVAFGYLAALTRRIELITGVLILPQRQTVLVAKQASDVDLLSDGRLRLGVGIGWNHVEYHALGEAFKTRGRKLDEQIPFLRRLWSEELITFEGGFHQMDRANITPRPRRRIPIYCGGFADAAFRRAARLADGFIFGFGYRTEALEGWARLQDILREKGRSIEGFGAQFVLHAGGRPFDIAKAVDRTRELQDAGATDVTLVTMGKGFTEVEQHIDFLAEAKAAIGAVGACPEEERDQL